MKGDFSRLRFEKSRHYTAVLVQQGRVQLDADANEQRLIDERLRAEETVDVVGPDGAPIHAAGFAISLRSDGASLTIGAGRFYVGGLLCENETPLDFTAQDYLIDPNTQIGTLLQDMRSGTFQSLQVSLEAWQRFVIPLDDPAIKEVALGEADTAARLQTVWRVVVQGVAGSLDLGVLTQNIDSLNQALGNLRLTASAGQAATVAPAQTDLAAALSALREQPAATAAISPTLGDNLRLVHADVVSKLSTVDLQSASGVQAVQAAGALGDLIRTLPSADCCAAMRARQPVLMLPGRLSVQVKSTPDQGPCLPAPNAAYRGLENQLYRVEIHQGGDASSATFKWSRDNGFVVTGIRGQSGSTLTVDSLGLDANFGFAPGQWVEISDDSNEFASPPNQPGTLAQIQATDPARMQVTLPGTAPGVDAMNGHAKMRRWDQTSGTSAGIALSPGSWIDLENGIQVMFSADGIFQSGDYWLIPARTATGDIEWPPAGSDGQLAQPAARTVVHRTPLACLHRDQEQIVVDDCRRIFHPLVEIVPPVVPDAVHVQKISWTNDDFISWSDLASTGLTITFDKTPSLPINDTNFIVTLELPVWSTFGFSFIPLSAAQLQAATALSTAAAGTQAAGTLSPGIVATEVEHPAVSPSLVATEVSQPTLMRAAAVSTAGTEKAAGISPTAVHGPAVRPGVTGIGIAAPITAAPLTVAPTGAGAATIASTSVEPVAAAPGPVPEPVQPAGIPSTVATTLSPEVSIAAQPAVTGAPAAPEAPSPAVAAVVSEITSAAPQINPAVLGGVDLNTPQQPAGVKPGIGATSAVSQVDLGTISAINIGAAQATAPDFGGKFTVVDPHFALPQRIGYARQPYVLDGMFGSADTAAGIRWTVRAQVSTYVAPLLVNAQNLLALGIFPRLRIVLKGHMIASAGVGGALAYLDGQCFGKGIARSDGSQRLDLALPSGNGAKASDFESWLYVVPQPAISLTLDPTTLRVAVGGTGNVMGTVTLAYPALYDLQVTFSVSDDVAPVVRFASAITTIPKGASSQTMQITMIGQNGYPAQIPITASLAGGNTTSAVVNWTVYSP